MVPPTRLATFSMRTFRANPASASYTRSIVERSEEHTSELQSRQYLVCRLLLEKKKQLLASAQTAGLYITGVQLTVMSGRVGRVVERVGSPAKADRSRCRRVGARAGGRGLSGGG